MKSGRTKFFNEATILMSCYHMFCFTDFVDDPIMRDKIGLSLICFTSLNLVVNCSVMVVETFFKLYRFCKVYYHMYRITIHVDKIKQRQLQRQQKSEWKAKKRAVDKELFYQLYPEERQLDLIKDQKQKEQLDPSNQIEHKKSQLITQEAPSSQLLEIEEVRSHMEESDRQQEIEVNAQFKRSRNFRLLTTGLEKVHTQQQKIQRVYRNTNSSAPISLELSSYQLTGPVEQSEEEKSKERKLQMMRIIFENGDFRKNSERLLEDIEEIQQQKEKRDTQTLTLKKKKQKLVINEIADLNKSRQAIQYDHQITPIFSEANDDLENQFAVGQKKWNDEQ